MILVILPIHKVCSILDNMHFGSMLSVLKLLSENLDVASCADHDLEF